MKFNPSIQKQAIEVIFSSKYKKPNHPPLTFNVIPVARKSSTKHLGVVLDERLTFREYVKEAIEKAKKGLALMKFLSKNVTSSILEMYVRPHLDYGDVIYHDQASNMMTLLESIQYQAGLIITKCWKGTNRSKLYKELGWESLSQRRVSRRFALYYKIKNNLTPEYLKSYIHPFKENSTTRFKNYLFPFCAQGWESLSDAPKNATTLNRFKTLLKNEIVPPKRGYFKIDDIFGIRLLTKLRVDFSDLREHRFNHKFINCPSPICKCSTEEESTEHFFVRCPLYASQRNTLLHSMSTIFKNDISILPDAHLVQLLLYGSKSYNCISNKMILEASISYIKSTKRFVKIEAFAKNT